MAQRAAARRTTARRGAADPTGDIFQVHAEFCGIFASPVRLRIMWLLGDGEMTVGDLAAALDLPLANVSQHLRVMRGRRAVVAEKRGRQVFYRIANDKILAGARLVREGLVDELRKLGGLF